MTAETKQNILDQVYFIKIDSSNKVIAHSSDTKNLSDGWIKISWNYTKNISTVGDFLWKYNQISNTVEEVPFTYFKDNRDKLVKEAKVESISSLTVTTSTGKTFDGDEKSQDRMVRAINIATITGQTTTNWKLADNTIVEVTLDELKEALALSGQAMSDIWLAR